MSAGSYVYDRLVFIPAVPLPRTVRQLIGIMGADLRKSRRERSGEALVMETVIGSVGMLQEAFFVASHTGCIDPPEVVSAL